MRATAKHWVNYNGTWHMQGETFEIDKADAEEMKLYAELIDDYDEQPVNEPTADEPKEPAKRGRKRKAETEE